MQGMLGMKNVRKVKFEPVKVAMSKYYNVSINYLITGEEFQKR